MTCLKNSSCGSGFCNNGFCDPLPADGNPCNNGQCSRGYACDLYTRRCQAFRTKDHHKGKCSVTMSCPPNHYCHDEKCMLAGDEGAECRIPKDKYEENFCKDGLECLSKTREYENCFDSGKAVYDEDGYEKGTCRTRCHQDADCPAEQVCGESVKILDRKYKICTKVKAASPKIKPEPTPKSEPALTAPSGLSSSPASHQNGHQAAKGVAVVVVLAIIVIVIIKMFRRGKSSRQADPGPSPHPSGYNQQPPSHQV